jgi:hypothetical protein
MFFFLSSFHNTSLFFFLPSYPLPCLVCFLWLLHRALHPIFTIVVTPTIDAYSRLLTPSPFAPTCLLPLTSGIATCSYLHVQVSHLLLPTSLLTFAIATFFCMLLPTSSFAFAIATFSHMLLPSLPIPVYFHHCHLLILTFDAYSHLVPSLSPL